MEDNMILGKDQEENKLLKDARRDIYIVSIGGIIFSVLYILAYIIFGDLGFICNIGLAVLYILTCSMLFVLGKNLVAIYPINKN